MHHSYTRIAVLGGAFDPVQNGHREAASLVMSAGLIDEVWLMPCYRHMFGKRMESAAHRRAMCALAAEGLKGVRVCDYEIVNRLTGSTFDIISRLIADPVESVNRSFSFIIGLDNANCFHQWARADELKRLLRFLVVPRTGITPDRSVDWYLHPPHLLLESPAPPTQCSSTQVRDLLALKRTWEKPLSDLIPEKVFRYIIDNELYLD